MSPGDDEHVRALLDQRAQRADVPLPHTRFSTFSDRSDSPSLYSHFDNNYRNTPATPAPRFLHSHSHDPANNDDHYARYPQLSPPEHIPDNTASTLDLSEHVSSESGEHISDLDSENTNMNLDLDDNDEDGDPGMRMSLLGPKMRVHSRAPWEEDEDSLSGSDLDDGGNDKHSIFGDRKSSRPVIRGFGFGSKSPVPRPSFDSSTVSKGKHSIETVSGVSPSGTSGSAIHALAQASMSSTSLALRPSPSSSRFPSKFTVGHHFSGRDRSASLATGTYDKSPTPPPLPSPRSAVHAERSSGRDSPLLHRRNSISPHRSEFSVSVMRTRTPSPISQDGNSVFMHPYANPALLSVYQRDSIVDPFGKDNSQLIRDMRLSRNDSVATLAASEETVILSHSSSAASASITSSSGLDCTTPPTSAFSLVSLVSQLDSSKSTDSESDIERTKRQKRFRRETKLGPISAPATLANTDFEAGKPYALISLEQAQARVKERNRSATTGAIPFPTRNGVEDGDGESTSRMRARSSSTTDNIKQNIAPLSTDNTKPYRGELPVPTSPTTGKQPSPVGPPSGKVLRPKRSGFMKLFNGREKDKMHDTQPPPVPPIADSHLSLHPFEKPHSPPATRVPKVSMHRVPVPILNPPPNLFPSAPSDGKDDSRSKKNIPSLSIKVTSPSSSFVLSHEPVPRRSDSPQSFPKSLSPKIPTSAPAGTTHFSVLKLRPVSGFFSSNFAEHFISEETSPGSPRNADTSSLISPTTIASSDLIPSPINAGFNIGNMVDHYYGDDRLGDGVLALDEEQTAIITALKEQIRTSRKAWQRQIWELEGQIRDLKAEVDGMKSGEVCEVCGRGGAKPEKKDSNAGVIHRPRAKTGCGARFASGNEV
ncbi:hypothetical protein M0805_003378 [Coniferiporia weirii]|nr:hypothetical protein M0805_003378 [Coniferiporia weirii]